MRTHYTSVDMEPPPRGCICVRILGGYGTSSQGLRLHARAWEVTEPPFRVWVCVRSTCVSNLGEDGTSSQGLRLRAHSWEVTEPPPRRCICVRARACATWEDMESPPRVCVCVRHFRRIWNLFPGFAFGSGARAFTTWEEVPELV